MGQDVVRVKDVRPPSGLAQSGRQGRVEKSAAGGNPLAPRRAHGALCGIDSEHRDAPLPVELKQVPPQVKNTLGVAPLVAVALETLHNLGG